MNVNETLRALRRALWSPDHDPTSRARVIDAAARNLDNHLSEGGELPDDWREDRVSSASRQHYIETGRYLTREDYAAGDQVDALYEVAGDYEVSVLDDLVQRAELRWICLSCGVGNAADAADCWMCATQRPEQARS